ncbi:TetR/AcrR family transcriptional regulator [Pseudonocardia ailaonensis]|uniref:TetR/AcrR family transcriptional regulator n=1 Tax=Pseudonocardia ailaonensis TaxID=367279 RepID=A0ABN2NNH6_9PSEU
MANPSESRADQLLRLAAELFAARGYPAVGMGAIGEAAGISGPAVYRYFPSKQSLLEAVCDRAMDRMLDAATRAVDEYDEADPRLALEALVTLHVGFAVDDRVELGVWVREQRHLTAEMRQSLRTRSRAYEMPWRSVVGQLRPDLDTDEVAFAVYSAIAMLNNSTVAPTELPNHRLRTILRRMTLSALLVRRAPGALSVEHDAATGVAGV